MMCNSSWSESGALCSIDGCAEYRRILDNITTLQDERDKLLEEKAALIQVSADVCPECGWAMKFPDEPCRNCEVHALRKENAALRQERDRLAAIVEKADDLAKAAYDCEQSTNYETIRLLERERYAYLDVRHGK